MKYLGSLLLIAGSLIAAYALFVFDASVASDVGSKRVMNVGLMSDRQNLLIAGCVAAIIGTLLLLFSKLSDARSLPVGKDTSSQGARTPHDGTRRCPFCAEDVKYEAIICKHCGRDLPVADAMPKRVEATAIEATASKAVSGRLPRDTRKANARLAVDLAKVLFAAIVVGFMLLLFLR